MLPAQPTILDQLDRPIGLFLRAPATAASARIVLCLPFWWSWLTKLLDFSSGTAEMAALGLEPAWLFNALTIFVQLGGSLLVILNRWTWLGAGALARRHDRRRWSFATVPGTQSMNPRAASQSEATRALSIKAALQLARVWIRGPLRHDC
jgi:hypothetical protein